MLWQKAVPKNSSEFPEVCINLWYFLDKDSGLIYRTSGRAYALAGTDEEKLAALHALSSTDFHVAQIFKIPSNFKVVASSGQIAGATTQDGVRNSHAAVFEPVFKGLEKDLPTQMRSRNGLPENYKLKIPESPLCVTTCVIEDEEGNLNPVIAQAS